MSERVLVAHTDNVPHDEHMMPFHAKKSLGQNFLVDQTAVAAIVTAAHLTPGERVLEIGPGTGLLTEALLSAGARVTAVEADARAVSILQERFAAELTAGTLTLHHADIRDTSPETHIEAPYATVANIPYYLTGKILRDLLSATKQPDRAVLLVQREVAERIARSEKESLLSLSVKAYATPRYVKTVPRGAFRPIPAVDSAILAIENISRERFVTLSESWFFTVLRAGFAARRKQLLGALATLTPRERLNEVFSTLTIAPQARGEDLTIDTWCRLAETLQNTP